jgi:WD40 repeat protein
MRKFSLRLIALAAAGSFTLFSFRGTSAVNTAGRILATGNMTAPRHSHTATLLPNGKVLIAGGMPRNGVFLATAEIYDPALGRFAPVGKMNTTRGYGSTATLLPDGKVLLAGGRDAAACTANSELYDPATGAFLPTGAMTTPRCGSIAVLLQTGDVLIMGGNIDSDDSPQDSAELYHPSSGTFSSTGSMQAARVSFAAVRIKDGKVLVVGGAKGGHALATAELYDPSPGRFIPAGSMNSGRHKLGAALLPDGRALIVGGQGDGPWGSRLSTTEIFDPGTLSFKPGPKLDFERFKLTSGVVMLTNGQTLIAGGADQAEVFDPASNSFLRTAGEKLDSFYFSTATLLSDGKVLIVGGYGHNPGAGALSHAWLYQP